MLSQLYLRVCQEFGEEEIEVPLEDDGTLLLTTLQSCFNKATGLKFRNPSSGCYRAVKLTKLADAELKFHPPGLGDDGWDCENITYLCVFPKIEVEAKVADDVSETSDKATKPAAPTETAGTNQPKTVDLIILNLSPQTTELELRNYFESKYGPLLMSEIKRDRKTGRSRCFAFIRFKNYKDQMRALGQVKHKIEGQQIRVGLPDYRDPSELYQDNKCFIGRVNEAIKAGDLREFFSQFGEIIEVSYPKKFKGYAFITFADAEIAQKMCGQDFVIKGYSVCVSKSTHGNSNNSNAHAPSHSMGQQQQQQHQRFSGYQQNDWNGGWFSRDQWVPGSSPYVTAPLNPPMDHSRNNSGFYGHSAALSAMGNSLLSSSNPNQLNALSMAMSNLLNNSMGQSGGMQNHNYRAHVDRPHAAGGTLWNSRSNNDSKTTNKKNKQKKQKNAKNNKPKDTSKAADDKETVKDDDETEDAIVEDVVVEEVASTEVVAEVATEN